MRKLVLMRKSERNILFIFPIYSILERLKRDGRFKHERSDEDDLNRSWIVCVLLV